MKMHRKKQLGMLSLLCGGALLAFAPVTVFAQNGMGDVSAELDFLPPQPNEMVLPEEGQSDAEKAIQAMEEKSRKLEEQVRAAEQRKTEMQQAIEAAQPQDNGRAVIDGLNQLGQAPDVNAPAQPVTPLEPVVAVGENANPGVSIDDAGLPEGPAPVPYSGTYYDADSIGPGNDVIDSPAPRRVDPKYEPGQKYIIVEKGPGANSRQAQLVAGRRALQLGRYASAMEIFQNLAKKNSRDKSVLMGLAVAQQHSGLKESAMRTYEKILSIDSKHKDALVNLMGLMKETNPTLAMRRLGKLLDKHPDDAGIAAQMGLISAEMGNTSDAMRFLGVAASIEPTNAGHYYNMAVITDRSGAHKDAVKLYEQALTVDASHGASRSVPRDQIYDRLAVLRRL